MRAGMLVVLGVLVGAGLFMLGAAEDSGAGAAAAGVGGLIVAITVWAGIVSGRGDDDHHPAAH